MPELIKLNEFYNGIRDPRCYFKNIYCKHRDGDQQWIFNINEDYQYITYFHMTEYNNESIENKFLYELHKFIKTRAIGDAILSFTNKSYKWCWNANTAKYFSDRGITDIINNYWIINFEYEEDMLSWKLSANNLPITDKMIDYLPQYPYNCDPYY
jgi:hypothetical protein